MKVFVDTNIFIDYYLDRKDNFLPLGEFAFQFFKRAIECEFFILICDFIVLELCEVLNLDEKELNKILFADLIKKNKITKIDFNEKQYKEAGDLSKSKLIPFSDALFAVLARAHNAILISRDKHYNEVKNIVEVKKPEEL